jgi:hypothetical protein
MILHSEVAAGLNAGAALCAFIAAALWFRASARVELSVTTWENVGSTQIKEAIQPGLRWNRRAAFFAGLSASLTASAIVSNLFLA